MKKIILTILSIYTIEMSYGQFSSTANPFTSGRVGIGAQNTDASTQLMIKAPSNFKTFSCFNTDAGANGSLNILNSGGGAFDAPMMGIFDNQNTQIFKLGGWPTGSPATKTMWYTGGNVGFGTSTPSEALQIGGFGDNKNSKLFFPGIYGFEQVKIGQYGNGAGGLEFINHSDITNSYGIRMIANSDEFSGLQIKIANPASSYGGLNFIRNFALGTDGRVFIGSSNIPAGNHKLSVDGNINLTSGNKKLNVNGVYNFEQTNIGQFGNGAGGLEFINHSGIDNSYGVRLMANSDEFSGLQIKTANPVASYGQLSYSTKMNIGLDGKVAIGNVTTPGNYLLYVEKGILTEEVKVALKSSTAWADYVFNKDYKLKSLKEVEEYIQENKHLPNVPSADELMNDGGVNVSSMMSKQMEKIEELTLYIIEQNKKLEKLQAQVNKLQNN